MDILRSLLKIFCGGQSSEDRPQYGQQQQGYPGQQQQAYPSPQQQQQQAYPSPQQQAFPPLQQQQSGYPGGQVYHPQQQQQQQNAWQQPHGHHGHGHGNGQQHPHGQGQQSHPSSPPPHQPSHPSSPPHQKPHDQDQVNAHNPEYTALRARANEAGDAMARAFDQSHAAYGSGDGAAAHQLSEQGKAHKREMEQLNEQAARWIFTENNKGNGPDEVDLHGLYVKEAIRYTDDAIVQARRRGSAEVRLIVGKGLHSAGHVAKIKPAIEELMQKHHLAAALDPRNAGVLIVSLDGQAPAGRRAMGADDISRSLQNKDDQCVIM